MRKTLVTSAAILVALLAFACKGGGADGTPGPGTPQARPSPSPITASGTIAFIGKDAKLWLVNPDGTNQRPFFAEGAVQAIEWSPDGGLIAAAYRPADTPDALTDVAVIDAEGNVVFRVEGASAPAWSPSGERLAVQRPHPNAPASGYSRQEFPPRIEVYDRSGSTLLEVADAINAAWSPDETELSVLRIPRRPGADPSAFVQGHPVIVALKSGDERPLSSAIEEHDLAYPVVWHPAGEVIAYRNAVYDRKTGESKALPGVPSFWSPDGRLLFMTFEYRAADDAWTGQLWDLKQAKPLIGVDVHNPRTGESPWLYIQRWVAWTPDSISFIYLDPLPGRYTFRMFDTLTLKQQRHLNIRGEAPSTSPDGKFVVFMDEGNVWAYRLDGKALEDIADGTAPAWRPEQ